MDPFWYTKYSGDGFIPNPNVPENEQNDDGKTGYTPLELIFPTRVPIKQDVIDQREYVERFQRKKLQGFTSRELANWDCLTTRELRPSTLTPVILPLFQQNRWEVQPSNIDFPIRNLYRIEGYPNISGNWVAGNPEVWKRILKPILVLASRMLISADVLDWFDALLNGEREMIAVDRIPAAERAKWNDRPPKDRLQSFRRRKPSYFKQSTVARDKLLEILITKYRFTLGFFKTDENPIDPSDKPSSCSDASGFVTANGRYTLKYPGSPHRIYAFFKYDHFHPLLSHMLNSSERMSLEWWLAQVIVHETIHACERALEFLDERWGGEFYFEDEPLREIGWSYEMATIGGVLEPMRKAPSLPLALYHCTPWIAKDHIRLVELPPILIQPSISDEMDTYPIPMSLIDDAHQEIFWEIGVRRFGHKLLRHRLLKEGIRLHKDGITKTRITRDPFQVDRANVENAILAFLAKDATQTPESRQILKFCNYFKGSTENENKLQQELQPQTEMLRLMQVIMPHYETKPYARQTIQENFRQLIATHRSTIKTLLEVESHRETKDRVTRRSLLVWNRGVRTCLRSLRPPSQEAQQMIEELLRVRKDLWNIDMIEGKSWDDYQNLDEAHRLYVEGKKNANETSLDSCLMLCELILNRDPVCAILVRNAAEMMILKLDLKTITLDPSLLRKRVAVIQEELDGINSTDPHYQHQAKWKDFASTLMSDIYWMFLN